MLARRYSKYLISLVLLSLIGATPVWGVSSRRTPTTPNISTYGLDKVTACGGGGCDYIEGELANWEQATDIVLTGAGQSAGEILDVWDEQASWDDGDTLDGATTDASYFRIVRPASGEGHDGTPNNGVTFVTSTLTGLLGLAEDHSQFQDLIGKNTKNHIGTTAAFFVIGSDNNKFVGCIAYDCNNADGTNLASGFWVFSSATNCGVINCLAHNCEYVGIHLEDSTGYLYNCTIQSCDYGVASESSTISAKNCLGDNNTTLDFVGGGLTNTNCASSDGTADDFGGANNKANLTITFDDAGGDDFHTSDSDIVGAGADLSGDGVLAFDDDINDGTMGAAKAGETRSAWDIGFDEYVAVVGVSIPIFMYHYMYH